MRWQLLFVASFVLVAAVGCDKQPMEPEAHSVVTQGAFSAGESAQQYVFTNQEVAIDLCGIDEVQFLGTVRGHRRYRQALGPCLQPDDGRPGQARHCRALDRSCFPPEHRAACRLCRTACSWPRTGLMRTIVPAKRGIVQNKGDQDGRCAAWW